ncbi:hypothetical protein ABC347_12945 [Sphingomonas sp. 1P06PA]|uniref:hypothetical protein n=1 Tax=Sphingomonas sp. 1P06PA TaxID=554121 RepID=UPI0039A54E29
MRPPAPLLFVIATLALWTGGRGAWLAMGLPDPAGIAGPPAIAEAVALPQRILADLVSPVIGERADAALPAIRSVVAARATPAALIDPPSMPPPPPPPDVARSDDLLLLASWRGAVASDTAPTDRLAARDGWIGPAPAAGPGRFAASAWIFERSGAARRAIAPGGQLGGSQFGVRATMRLDRRGRLALAARLSGPRRDLGAAEAALGLDWNLVPEARLSVERRIALGPRGRDAWSAYAAGGFYLEPSRGSVVDGYAQAGVVGLKSLDLFADGAVRGGGKVAVGPDRTLILGGGAWGAAQPDANRLDIGPRAALALPIGPAQASLALEGRFRVAGDARPGSGLALTLASDF